MGHGTVAAHVEGVSAPRCGVRPTVKCARHGLDGLGNLGLLVGVDVAARLVAVLTDPVPHSECIHSMERVRGGRRRMLCTDKLFFC